MKPIRDRPDPDALLGRITSEARRETRGTLKIFLGMCAGVGKTYTMLELAHQLVSKGKDVVVGIVETHGRAKTESLLTDLEVLPRQVVQYRQTNVPEFDLDAALQRRPDVILVDELAHTNAPGSIHPKRWQDVMDLLQAGIDVLTTVNIQHIESRADAVHIITGVPVRETVPDMIIDNADDVEVVDIAPTDLLQRLSNGEVYRGSVGAVASDNFFRISNLTALRELALRAVAERVEKDLLSYSLEDATSAWSASERLIVGISSSPSAINLIRWTRMAASSRNAQWIAAHVRTGMSSDVNMRAVERNISAARDMGAVDVVTVDDANLIHGLISAARRANASTIVIGKPKGRGIAHYLAMQKLIRLVDRSEHLDIAVIDSAGTTPSRLSLPRFESAVGSYIPPLFGSVVTIAICFALESYLGYQSIGMVLLLYVALLPLWTQRGPILATSAFAALMWNAMFIPPRFTFAIGNIEDRLTFALYFVVAIASAIVSSRIRKRESVVQSREERTDRLYRLSRDISAVTSMRGIMKCIDDHISEFYQARLCLLLARSDGHLGTMPVVGSTMTPDDKEFAVATWAFDHKSTSGMGTNNLPSASAVHYPLMMNEVCIGILSMQPRNTAFAGDNLILPSLLEQVVTAIDRELLRAESERRQLAETSEELYKVLLNTVSHEIRTPLSTMIGGADAVMTILGDEIPSAVRSVLDDVKRSGATLDRVVHNLLDMSRIESGKLALRHEWTDIRDIVNNVVDQEMRGRISAIDFPDSVPLLNIDPVLIERALRNIVANAVMHTPPTSEIHVSVVIDKDRMRLAVADTGRGISVEHQSLVFHKFHRLPDAGSGGMGLGLSIAKGLVELHHGTIELNSTSFGSTFTIVLPVESGAQVV